MRSFFNKKILIVILVLLISLLLWTIFKINSVNALSRYGSSGEEVKQIQTKLKNWGYYNGAIDGIFGSRTLKAVKSFQSKNGLTADGIVGDKTLAALGISSSKNSSSSRWK